MGKLNYAARKITGIKAAQVVSKDLKKRIPPGISSKAAARDPHVEIDLTGKELTDEGFLFFIDDLLECIQYRDEEHTEGLARVTELHLQKNELTVQSLARLSEVIALSAGDLRELDLSQNNIRVKSPEEQIMWRDFLLSFKHCYMLKKLDLGSNPLGPAGVEILARVYIKSDLDFLETDADAVIGPHVDETTDIVEQVTALKIRPEKEKENEAPKHRAKKLLGKAKAPRQNGHSNAVPTVTELKRYACTRGLRSIPYLIITDVSMTSSSAVQLASMLVIQRTQEHLLSFLPGGKAVTLPDAVYECKSLVWKPNDGLTPHAKRLLEVAAAIGDLQGGSASEDEQSDDADDNYGETNTIAQRKLQKKMDLEYTRLTKRVRMEALKVEGLHSMELWATSLKMMVISRALLLDDKDRAVDEPSDKSLTGDHEETTEAIKESVEAHVDESVQNHMQNNSTLEIVTRQSPPPYCVQSPSLGPFQPGSDIFEEHFPALQAPVIQPTSNGNHQAVSVHEKEIPIQEKEATPSASSLSPSKDTAKSGKGSPRASNGNKLFHKKHWRFGLPLELWRRVIAEAVGADGILDVQQQVQIMRYASDWNSVEYEMTITGAEDHQQIWKILETVNCFTYSPLKQRRTLGAWTDIQGFDLTIHYPRQQGRAKHPKNNHILHRKPIIGSNSVRDTLRPHLGRISMRKLNLRHIPLRKPTRSLQHAAYTPIFRSRQTSPEGTAALSSDTSSAGSRTTPRSRSSCISPRLPAVPPVAIVVDIEGHLRVWLCGDELRGKLRRDQIGDAHAVAEDSVEACGCRFQRWTGEEGVEAVVGVVEAYDV
ncbi:leucine rich repeat protein [Aspergillus terreus]|uniref:Leucine rich repeat protein n=1 Tax=Aspergillus terreus TaxID=33178 RepID=A0A5M3Z1W3_ASPTE|nr:hypothetical protein ATETN484_0005057000 [Aspergillus terreus]GFF17222.1 leucine rich repeat protein [Aspergillus terreus]